MRNSNKPDEILSKNSKKTPKFPIGRPNLEAATLPTRDRVTGKTYLQDIPWASGFVSIFPGKLYNFPSSKMHTATQTLA